MFIFFKIKLRKTIIYFCGLLSLNRNIMLAADQNMGWGGCGSHLPHCFCRGLILLPAGHPGSEGGPRLSGLAVWSHHCLGFAKAPGTCSGVRPCPPGAASQPGRGRVMDRLQGVTRSGPRCGGFGSFDYICKFWVISCLTYLGATYRFQSLWLYPRQGGRVHCLML